MMSKALGACHCRDLDNADCIVAAEDDSDEEKVDEIDDDDDDDDDDVEDDKKAEGEEANGLKRKGTTNA
jgi:hypothetical protein